MALKPHNPVMVGRDTDRPLDKDGKVFGSKWVCQDCGKEGINGSTTDAPWTRDSDCDPLPQ